MMTLIAAMLMLAAAAPPAADVPPPAPKKVCRYEPVTGSNMGKRICLTVEEWKTYYRARERDEGGFNLPRTTTGQVGG